MESQCARPNNKHILLSVVLCWCVGHVHPAHVHYTSHTCTPRPQAVNGHLRPPYPGPISLDTAHIRLDTVWGQEPKKVDDAVVFGLRGMHNDTHLGYVMTI